MRIAVSGPAGAGKTTLVRALSTELSLPVVDERLLDLYNAQNAYRQITRTPGAPPEVQARALTRWKDSYFAWCDARGRSYEERASFVADRWELDLFGYWLHAFVQYDTYEDTRRLQELFLQRAEGFDLIIMLPVGNFAVDEHNEVGLRRQTSYNRSVLTQTSFTGLLYQVPQTVSRYVPLSVEPVDKRVADIVGIVNTLRRE